MGCNYYWLQKVCPTCKRSEDKIHLGKESCGWKFSFQYNGGKFYKNVEEMKKWLEGKQITDECGRKISKKEFWGMVKEKQEDEEAKSHSEKYPSKTNFVIDGYSLSDCEFC